MTPGGASPAPGAFGEPARLVGNCVDSFDADGWCLVDELPWADVSAFACAEEGARSMTATEFASRVEIPGTLADSFVGRAIHYLEAEGVLMAHDLIDDVHHFFA